MPRFKIDCNFSPFQKDLKDALKRHPSIRDDLSGLFVALQDDYQLGDWIPGCGAEARKVRLGVKKNRIGKSSGYRLVYLVDKENNVIVPLCLHFKPDIAAIPSEEVARLVIKATEKLLSDAATTQEGTGPVN